MKLRAKFVFFIVVIHTVMIVASFYLLEEHRWLFVLSEFLILISIGISVRLYQEFIRPLNLISAGIESMKDKDFSTKFVEVGQVEMDQLIGMYNQMITQLRQERITQQEQHFFLERLIEALPSGIIILDLDEKITSLNPAAEFLLKVKTADYIGKDLCALNGQLPEKLSQLKSGESVIVQIDGIQAFKCQKSHFIDQGFHHHFITIEELTEQLLKTEKRAYEKVIRMMSHEINNSIGAINSILNSVLNYKNQLKRDDVTDFENGLQVAIERNEKLNHFMGNFANVVRTPLPIKEITDLHKLLKNVQILMAGECQKRNISMELELSAGQFWVECDVQQMEQVLLNILKNSAEAIENDGRIIIQTQNQSQKCLTILDSGRGIPVEIQQHLFTPFFSTKKDGQGIGLTLIREILINHGFRFNLEITAEDLTAFQIDFM